MEEEKRTHKVRHTCLNGSYAERYRTSQGILNLRNWRKDCGWDRFPPNPAAGIYCEYLHLFLSFLLAVVILPLHPKELFLWANITKLPPIFYSSVGNCPILLYPIFQRRLFLREGVWMLIKISLSALLGLLIWKLTN